MKFAISDVSKKLRLQNDVVKTMSKVFSEYLSSGANPSTGITREFCLDDLRVFSYASYYWEDEPDIESIKIGLNNGEHFEYPFNEIVSTIAPVFSHPPDGIEDPVRTYVLFNEMRDGMELFHLAGAYKTGGDMLVDAAIENHNGYEIIYPIIYNYRHAVELYLKSFVGSMANTHNLLKLYTKFKELARDKFGADPAEWFETIIKTLNEFDPGGTAFRYGTSADNPRYEVFVDLSILRTKMNLLSKAFREIHAAF